jgi:serine/threonine protein kinase
LGVGKLVDFWVPVQALVYLKQRIRRIPILLGPLSWCDSKTKRTGDDIFRNIIANEAIQLSRLHKAGQNPYIPALYQKYSEQKRWSYIVLERFPLGSLAKYIQQYPSISVECVFGIGWRLIKCLESMHCAQDIGWLHLDIKPDNIMITEDPERGICLIDFGMTLPLPYIQSQPRTSASGTYAFMGTHVWDVEKESKRDDVESVGLTMAYLFLEGKLPWIGDTPDIMQSKIQAKTLPKTLANECKQPLLEPYLKYVRAFTSIGRR